MVCVPSCIRMIGARLCVICRLTCRLGRRWLPVKRHRRLGAGVVVTSSLMRKGVKSVHKYIITKGNKGLLTTCVCWFETGQPCLCRFPAPLARRPSPSPNTNFSYLVSIYSVSVPTAAVRCLSCQPTSQSRPYSSCQFLRRIDTGYSI